MQDSAAIDLLAGQRSEFMGKPGGRPSPSFREALKFWSLLGWISFGGTAGHIAIMHDYLVERKKWISNASFLHALSLCMLLPGPEAQQLAIYIGWQLHGRKGGLVAGTLFVLPSMLILLCFSIVYVLAGNQPWLLAIFSGLKPAVIALVVIALFRVGKRALRGALHVAVTLVSFVAMYFFNVSLPLVMAAAIALAICLFFASPSMLKLRGPGAAGGDSDAPASAGTTRFRLQSAIWLLLAAAMLWSVPLGLFFVFANDFGFWKSIALYFTKTACVTVGGSYTVIPYVAQSAVAGFQWLSNTQMADGFALAETTPGPLIIVVAFVGFMAGYNHFHGSLLAGSMSLLATTFYTFLPCFFWVFLGAPLVERSEKSQLLDGVLGLISSVVVGAIGQLTLFLSASTLLSAGTFPPHLNVFAIVWAAVALALITFARMKIVWIITLSVIAGLLQHWARTVLG